MGVLKYEIRSVSNVVVNGVLKSRITYAEATVVQKMNIAMRQERAVIVPALNFLLLFVSRQKVNRK